MEDVVSMHKWPAAATSDECALIAVCGSHRLAAVSRREPRRLWTVGSEQPHGRLVWHGSRLVLEPPGAGHAGWQVDVGVQLPCPRHEGGHRIDVSKILDRLSSSSPNKPVHVRVAEVTADPPTL